jgi:hypothetical protein
MAVFLATLLIMLAAVAAMAIGRLFGRRGIQGSCGAIAGVNGGSQCAACTRPCARHRAGRG